jgi:MFS family permease
VRIPRTVVALGVVSLLTDLSSEMIYPLLPLFLTAVLGAGPLALGWIEGAAESVASFLKLISGLVADRLPRRKPLVLAGYGLSGLVRPLVGLANSWPVVSVIRVLDRTGKGLRTSPRDALIADVTADGARGRSFGFHRSMDHAGAVLGPLAAAGLLKLGVSLRTVFLLAAFPAVLVLLTIVFAVREPERRTLRAAAALDLHALRELGPRFWRLLAAIALFTLGNSTDAFLLLALSGAGVDDASVALLWAAHHVVKMGSSYASGRLSDRIGRRIPLLAGWLLYALVYAGFGFFQSEAALITTFLVYGLYFGLTEATERAWVADLVPARLRGTAYGAYNGSVGIAALPASLLFGWIWTTAGRSAAFLTGSALALAAGILLVAVSQPALDRTAN